MNKKIKSVIRCITLIIITVGIFGPPKESEATTYTYTHPEMTLYIEFVDQKGQDFPIVMGMEGNYNGGTMSFSHPYYVNPSGTFKIPLSITRTGGNNVFALNLRAETGTVQKFKERYITYLSSLKINTPIPVIKSFSYVPINGSLPLKNRLTYEIFRDGVRYADPTIMTNHFWIEKNADHTFTFKGVYNTAYHNGNDVLNYMIGHRDIMVDNTGQNPFTRAYSTFGIDGETLRFYANFYQVKEIFEDQSGASIPAPSGYTNGNLVDITTQPFGYQMVNGSNLPKTYSDSTYIYTYDGWYKGSGNKGSMVTTHPPSINFNADLNEAQNEVHIVYNKRLIRTINEEYIDTGSATIDPIWNNMGQQKADGDTFTATPAATKTDSSSAIWEYQGWKLSTEPMSAMRPKTTPVSVLIDANKTIQYVYKKKQHTITEKWVDQTDGTTLVPMTTNPKTNSIDDNDPFNGSATATITDSNNGIWDYVGWENVTDDAGNIVPASTPLTINNIKAGKEIRYHYQARNTTATLDLKPTPQVVSSGGNVAWGSRLTNTGSSTLNNLKLKATSNWASGLSAPTQVTVTPAGGAPQNFTVTPSDWSSGFSLTGVSVPNAGPNNYADITFTDVATGAVNQVLPAEIELTGNMANPLKAENFVRIDDPDEPNLEPGGHAGLINIPNFKFGDVEVKPSAQTKGLDAASYQSGYNPYIRFMDMESGNGWSLTVKLGQFTSGSKTLPTATTIRLKNGVLMEVQDYNKHNESLSYVNVGGAISIPSDSTTVALTNDNNQGVYQLEYSINNVELDLLAHSGVAGLTYRADMDWTLTTAP